MPFKLSSDCPSLRYTAQIVFHHYALSPEARKVAMQSALEQPQHAPACYTAIVRSLVAR